MNLKQNQGFSLVELMVVVAIIGILATVAVPNFMKFQAKAKQTNAKVELSSIFTAEKAFYTEYSTYHTILPYIGYTPDGCTDAGVCTGAQRYYTTGFASAGGINSQIGTAGPLPATLTYQYPSTVGSAVAVDTSATTSAVAFVASAAGNIGAGYTADTWTVNEIRVLTNTKNQ